MKVIRVPDPVDAPVRVQENGRLVEKTERVEFAQFLGFALRMNPEFGDGPESARRYKQIKEAVSSMNGASEIRLGDADYQALWRSVRQASWGDPELNLSYLPFAEAVEKAEDAE